MIGKDSYLQGNPDENAVNSGCVAGEGVISFQFSKMWEYAKVLSKSNLSDLFSEWQIFQEDYIIKGVDLLAGLGGAMGLWLGWSIMTLGELIVTLIKLFKASISSNK